MAVLMWKVAWGGVPAVVLLVRVLWETFDVTPDFVVSVVAGVLALALEVVPGLRRRWEVLPAEAKRFAWLVGCVLVGTAPWLLGCLGRALGVHLSGLAIVGACEVGTFARGMQVAFMAYFASQSVHGLSVAGLKAAAYLKERSQEMGA